MNLDLACECTHLRGDHARNHGECLEDECDCTHFRAMAPPLKKGAARALFALAMSGPMASITEAALVFGITRQAVHEKLAELVARGLVRVARSRRGRGPHGSIRITVTPAGDKLASHCPTCGSPRAPAPSSGAALTEVA